MKQTPLRLVPAQSDQKVGVPCQLPTTPPILGAPRTRAMLANVGPVDTLAAIVGAFRATLEFLVRGLGLVVRRHGILCVVVVVVVVIHPFNA